MNLDKLKCSGPLDRPDLQKKKYTYTFAKKKNTYIYIYIKLIYCDHLIKILNNLT